jgi:hypothetical protein
LRTPSPTKLRLPGPQRTQSITKSSIGNITLKPTLREPTRATEAIKKVEPSRQKSSISERARPSQPVEESPLPLVYSRETLESRLELLHLHSTHLPSNKTQSQWKDNAYQLYKKQFEDLQKRNSTLNAREIEIIEQKNAATILSWGDQSKGTSIEYQAQKASAIIDEVYRLSSPDGKYTLAIQAFEHWYDAVDQVQLQRTANKNVKSKVNVIEGLGDGWKAEIALLQTKILNAADDMLGLEEINPGGSDLERAIAAVSEMLKNMLEELEMVVSIEAQIVKDEKDWIEGSIHRIANELKTDLTLK